MRYLFPFILFTLGHFALSFGSLFIGGGIVMAAFDGDGSDLLAMLSVAAMSVLLLPIVNGLSDVIPGMRGLGTTGQYALFLLNSMLWGAAATTLWSWWRDRRRRLAGA